MKDEIQIAKILRPHGIKGALKISSNLGDIPFSKFSLVMVGEDKENMHIKRVQPLPGGLLLVQIDEITSCEQAEFYRNQGIYVGRSMSPDVLPRHAKLLFCFCNIPYWYLPEFPSLWKGCRLQHRSQAKALPTRNNTFFDSSNLFPHKYLRYHPFPGHILLWYTPEYDIRFHCVLPLRHGANNFFQPHCPIPYHK